LLASRKGLYSTEIITVREQHGDSAKSFSLGLMVIDEHMEIGM